MNKTKYISLAVCLAAIASLAIAGSASAQAMPTQAPNGGWQGQMHGGPEGMGGMMMDHGEMRAPGVFGKVSAVNGTTLTVAARQGFGTSTATTKVFTVDASNATVKKNNATSTVSSIVVGDTVMVQGTVTGTNVVATMIRDGVVPMRSAGMMGGKGPAGKSGWSATSTPAFSGNGEPVVAGTVGSVNGSSVSITNKSNVSYIVDVTSAKVLAGNAASSVANIKVGDMLLVQGTVNGNAITATTVIDQPVKAAGANAPTGGKPVPHGILGGIQQFFSHLFGF